MQRQFLQPSVFSLVFFTMKTMKSMKKKSVKSVERNNLR